MKQNQLNLRKTALAAGIAVALFAGTTMISTDTIFYLTNDVHAAQGESLQQASRGSRGR